jgi:hypothetical protein
MKIRFDAKKYGSLILMFLMLGSTLAYSMLQAFRNWQQPQENTSVPELPASNVIDYAVTAEQRNYMLRIGRVVLEYRYQLTCTECADQRVYIEAVAREFPDQIFVQEIIDPGAAEPTLSITSYYGSKFLADPSNEETFDALCDLMTDPPIACATRNI